MKKNDCITNKETYTLVKRSGGDSITVRDLQLEILTIMDEIHRVCIKNKVEYCLIAGSALGICNYKGFIPWDDDIDVCIKREDWEKFLKALNKDLNNNFYFQCFENDSKYNVLIPSMKIRKKNTYIEETNFLLKNRCKSGDGIFVDVVIYDNISENKLIDEINRTKIRLLMPLMVLLDNMHIPFPHLKKLVLNIAKKYSKNAKNSKFTSQTIAIPWEKFMNEPIFLKEDVFPFKLYDFEGRKYYSYNNIENVMKSWYGPNCLKKWDGKKWIETLPIEKRKPKHAIDINLKGNESSNKKNKSIFKKAILFAIALIILSVLIFNQASLVFLGIGIIIIGFCLLYIINKKN